MEHSSIHSTPSALNIVEMFPAWSIPPQHAETVGARRARISKEQEAKRSNSASSMSSESTAEVKANVKADDDSSKSSKKSFFRWGSSNKNKEIQEITPLPSLKTNTSAQSTIQKPLDTPPLTPSSQQEPFASQSRQPSLTSAPLPLPPQPIAPSSPSLSTGLAITPPGSNHSAGSDVDRVTSQFSNVSLGKRTVSSDRLTSLLPSPTYSDRMSFSVRSVLSSPTNHDSAVIEEGYQESCFSTAQSELTDFDCRSSRTLSMHCNAQPAFTRALAKLENASPRIIAARLGEDWGRLEDDESQREIVFEQRLWALTAYQRLTQNRQLQMPAHDVLSRSTTMDQRRILHLHGSLADGWMLASRYPAVTVYTTSPSPNFNTPTSYTAPLNHHTLYVPSLSAAMPFPDCYFDAIVSRSVSTVLQTDQWAQSFSDFKRILKPGGQIDILSIDPHLSSEGPKLSTWVNEHITSKLEEQGISKLPSDTLLDTMEKVGLENIRRARVALPESTMSPRMIPGPNGVSFPPPQDMGESIKMMAYLGRHFYQDLYGKTLELGADDKWFWTRKDIQNECERLQTKILVTIACAQKPCDPSFAAPTSPSAYSTR